MNSAHHDRLRFSLAILAAVLGSQPIAAQNAADLQLALAPNGGSWAPNQLGSFDLVINPGNTLANNADALAAFNRAANNWKSHFTDPITVNINADVLNLGSSSIIGQTGSVLLQADYSTIRNQMVTDAAGQPGNGIVASLPTAAQFTATLPTGFTLSGNLVLTKANAKALGFTGLDGQFGSSDGTIQFNSQFNFDYDNRDGVTAGSIDFETVATHEIGHLLGFISAVDAVDQTLPATGSVSPNPLDLFRFSSNSPNNPSTSAEFTSFPRNLKPNDAAVFDDLDQEYRVSTGISNGDGRQGSHWRDDSLSASLIGVMDPTLATGLVETVTYADLRALDVIGYDLAVPEPSTYAAAGAVVAMLAGQWLRRSRKQLIVSP